MQVCWLDACGAILCIKYQIEPHGPCIFTCNNYQRRLEHCSSSINGLIMKYSLIGLSPERLQLCSMSAYYVNELLKLLHRKVGLPKVLTVQEVVIANSSYVWSHQEPMGVFGIIMGSWSHV